MKMPTSSHKNSPLDNVLDDDDPAICFVKAYARKPLGMPHKNVASNSLDYWWGEDEDESEDDYDYEDNYMDDYDDYSDSDDYYYGGDDEYTSEEESSEEDDEDDEHYFDSFNFDD